MNTYELEFDYSVVQGQQLKRAVGSALLVYDDGSLGFDEVSLVLDNCSLVFSVDNDTDQIHCRKVDSELPSPITGQLWHDIEHMQVYLGSAIGWSWICKNWLGYTDMAVISFSGLEPSVAMIGIASKLGFYRLEKLLVTSAPAAS